MTFHVITPRRARQDYERCLDYIAAHSKPGAVSWAKAFDKALARLEDFADTCPLAVEDDRVDFEVREIPFKTRRGLKYRILFTIQDGSVVILHVRGPGQDYLESEEIRRPE